MAYVVYPPTEGGAELPVPAIPSSRAARRKRSFDPLLAATMMVYGRYIDWRDCCLKMPVRDEAGDPVCDSNGEVVTGIRAINRDDHWMWAQNDMAVTEKLNEKGQHVIIPADQASDRIGRCRLSQVTRDEIACHLYGRLHPRHGVQTVIYTRSHYKTTFTLGHGNRTEKARLAKHPLARLLQIPAGKITSENFVCLMLVFDFDFHLSDEQLANPPANDVEALVEWFVKKYMPAGVYVEPSTGGQGRHLYFKLAVRVESDLGVVKNVLEMFIESVNRDPEKPHTVATLDLRICNFPSLLSFEFGKVVDVARGQCMKLPLWGGRNLPLWRRLRNVARFNACPIYFLRHFKDRTVLPICSTSDTTVPTPNRYAPPSEDGGAAAPRPPRRDSLSYEEELEAVRREVFDPLLRARMFYNLQNRRFNRVLTPDEIDAVYVGLGLNRTTKHERRKDLWRAQYPVLLREFKPSLGKLMPSAYVEGHFHQILIERIPTDLLYYPKNKGQGRIAKMRIRISDLDFICHIVWDTCQKHGTCYLSFGTLRKLYRQQFNRYMGEDHASACIHLLVEQGVLRLVSHADYNSRHAAGYSMADTSSPSASATPNRYAPPTRVELSNRAVYRRLMDTDCMWPANEQDYAFLDSLESEPVDEMKCGTEKGNSALVSDRTE